MYSANRQESPAFMSTPTTKRLMAWRGCQLNELKKAGISVDLFDTAEISLSELYGHYIKDAVPSSVRKRYRIAHLFGTQKRSGIFFGKEQPSLLFYAEGSNVPTDVYPHDKEGRRISIEEFLVSKLE